MYRAVAGLVIEDPEVSRNDLVLQDGPGRDIDPVPVVRDDDHSPPKADSSTEGDVTGYGDVIQLQHTRDGSEPGEEVGDLLEVVVPQLHQRRGREHSLRGHDEGALLQAVQVRHHQQQVTRLLHKQKSREKKMVQRSCGRVSNM